MDVEAQPLTFGARSETYGARSSGLRGPLYLEDQRDQATENSYQPKGMVSRTWQTTDSWLRYALVSSTSVTVAATLVLLLASALHGRLHDRVAFFVIGDWGRQGTTNQTLVAELMGRAAARLQPQFIVSSGDNFYPNGLNTTDDALFQQSFMDVYTAPGLQVPWHAVLGNHDYGDGYEYCEWDADKEHCTRSPMHQLGTGLARRDSRWHCERLYDETFGGGLVQLFFIDTNPFIAAFQTASWAKYDGGILQQSWEEQLRELEQRLAKSTAPWKLMVGHHPPRSNGKHGNNTELMTVLEPLIAKYGVQAYFSGHDHDLEHLHVREVGAHYVVTGGGSDCHREFQGAASSVWQYPGSGFVAAAVAGDTLTVDFYTLDGDLQAAHTLAIRR